MDNSKIYRGDIYICDFGESKDHTIAKTRPVVVLQNNLANVNSQTIIVSALTTNSRVGELPIGVKLEPGLTGLNEISYVHLGHIYTIDKCKINKRVGTVPKSEMEKVNKAILISLGIEQYTL
jgi:mRNA interferase MazF